MSAVAVFFGVKKAFDSLICCKTSARLVPPEVCVDMLNIQCLIINSRRGGAEAVPGATLNFCEKWSVEVGHTECSMFPYTTPRDVSNDFPGNRTMIKLEKSQD